MQTAPVPGPLLPKANHSTWARQHIDLALRILYGVSAAAFFACIGLFSALKQPMLLGVVVGFGVVRGIFLTAERLGESVFLENIASGNYVEAMRGPGIPKPKQVQVLRREVSNRENRPFAERVAAYASYCLDSEGADLGSVARQFEDVWGSPPQPGGDGSLVAYLLDHGFRFSTPVNAPPEAAAATDLGIPWKRLWRDRLWNQLKERHPGESLPRLMFRLYASEWQSTLAPVWVVLAIAAAVLLSKPYLAPLTRAVMFYSAGLFLAVAAIWLAFILRPGAFNASLLADDMDRCARWVLESTEGRHFLTSALGSGNPMLRQKAVRLLIWNDILLNADITLPEGMRAFCRREGTPIERQRQSRQEKPAGGAKERTKSLTGPGV